MTNTRVKINSQLLFEGFVADKHSILALAARAKLCERTIGNMLNDSQPNRGFYSDGVHAVCAALGKDAAVVIAGKLPRRSRSKKTASHGVTINGFSAELVIPEIRRQKVSVPANASLHDMCVAAELIHLPPGASVVFDHYDQSTRWTHDPAACLEQGIYQETFVYPKHTVSKFLSSVDVKNACDALDAMHRQAVIHWLTSFGVPRLRILAERDLPIADLVSMATDTLRSMARPVDPCWAELPAYIELLQSQLRSTTRPINISVRRSDRSRAGVARWRSVQLHRHLDRLKGNDRDAWKAVGPWCGPAGESTTPAGDGFPLPTAPAGACILYAGRLNESELLVHNHVARFGAPGDQFVNESAQTLYCRLACNDPFPGDNLGVLDIGLEIHPKPLELTS